MLQVFADQVASLKAQIASKESGIEEATLVKERDSAIAKANELQSRNQKVRRETENFSILTVFFSKSDLLSLRIWTRLKMN